MAPGSEPTWIEFGRLRLRWERQAGAIRLHKESEIIDPGGFSWFRLVPNMGPKWVPIWFQNPSKSLGKTNFAYKNHMEN